MQVGQSGGVLLGASQADEDQTDSRCNREDIRREDTRDPAALAHVDNEDLIPIPGGELSGHRTGPCGLSKIGMESIDRSRLTQD